MKDAPNKLRLVDGKLHLADGGDPSEYLKEWAARLNITPDTCVVIMEREAYLDLRLAASWAAIG